MPDILHRVDIKAPAGDVLDAVATRDGLAQWWTPQVDGESEVGGDLRFHFGNPEPSAVMTVEEITDRRVQWRCTQGPDEWKDTTVIFELKPGDDRTTLLFTHAGWREPVEFMHHCSTKWGYYLVGLKSGLETGDATPWPAGDSI